jgi:hypothetical protein
VQFSGCLLLSDRIGIIGFGSTTVQSTVLVNITFGTANSQPGSGGIYVYPAGYFTASFGNNPH